MGVRPVWEGVMRGKPERKRRLRRPGRRWVFNNTMDPREREWDSAYWIRVYQGMATESGYMRCG